MKPIIDHRLFFGLAGKIVSTISPHSEASEAALLSQFLCAFGNAVGRHPHFVTEADQHRGNLFVVNVGLSAKGRKGTSWGYIEKIFKEVDSEWFKNCVKSGLSSGEGLIHPLRDLTPEELNDPFLSLKRDTRLLCIESEFSSILKAIAREGNILSPVIRNAWDSRKLETLTRNNPISVSDPHLSIVGHITKVELMSHLKKDEIWNGFGNRFLFFYVERSKILPEGGNLSESDLNEIVSELKASILFARSQGQMKRTDGAKQLWASVYEDLSTSKPGLVGILASRCEAQVVRLSLVQALLNRKSDIDEECLQSALDIHSYCIDSLRYIFGELTGHSGADRIFEELKSHPQGLTRAELHGCFNKHIAARDLTQNLEILKAMNLIRIEVVATAGRNAERIMAFKDHL